MNPLVFIAWLPLIELLLLIAMAAAFGFWFTLAWIVGTAILGIVLLNRARAQLAEQIGARQGWRMTPPPQGLGMPGLLATWVGAVLLILPGPLTDLVGLWLVIPALRRLGLGLWLTRQAEHWANRRHGAGRVYEGEVVAQTESTRARITVVSERRPGDSPK
ncbi:FxsA family protein [Halothiobacillus sp. DCM-1]|uniref:FxsA family protein n=1 Tax=Halothiobacillus sp. DCM-1 TaxID=3112558 RepID=UPI00324D0C81